MTWLRFNMDLTEKPSDGVAVSEETAPNLSENFEPSVFDSNFAPKVNLVEGRLSIMEDSTEIHSFKAKSGLRGFQYSQAQSLIGRGPIPTCRKIGINAYIVRTSPFDLSNSATENNFYYIEPDTLDVDGVLRGELGIQSDSEGIGSGGSIALQNQTEWEKFQTFMKDYLGKGFSAINLVVEYTDQGNTIQPPQLPTSGQSVVTVAHPKPGEKKKVKEAIAFSGTAQPGVAKIVVTVEPEKTNLDEESKLLYLIGEVSPSGGTWSFEETLVNTGVRHFKLRALDQFGNLLQTVSFDLIIE